MAEVRLGLHSELVEALGSPNVYFQPPSNIVMKYPCIVYGRSSGSTKHSNNEVYDFRTQYRITLISRDPDDSTFVNLVNLRYSSFDRYYAKDGLNHDVFIVTR